MKRFLSMLATLVLVGQSVVTPAVYATQGASENEESVSETVVETTIDESDADDGSSDDEVVADVDDSTNDAEDSAELEESADAEESVKAEDSDTLEDSKATEDNETSEVVESEIVEETDDVEEISAEDEESSIEEPVSYGKSFSSQQQEKSWTEISENRLVVTAIDSLGAFPEGTKMVVKAVEEDHVFDLVNDAIDANVTKVKAVDITFWYNEEEVQPEQPINVKISALNMAEPQTVVHIDAEYNDEKIEVGEADVEEINSEINGKTAEFEAESFSIYAIASVDRLQVNFKKADGSVLASGVIRNTADLESFIYYPEVSDLGKNEIFRGWNDSSEFTTGTQEADVKAEIESKYNDLVADEDKNFDEIDFYAMIFNHYTITYQDEDGVVIHTDELLFTGESQTYVINLQYTPKGQDSNFEGWKKVVNGIVTGDPIENETSENIEGDLILRAYAPQGHWLVFKENGKGVSYTPPQFVKTGTVEPADPSRLGYDFGGWYMNESCTGNRFTFGGELTERTTLFAKWTTGAKADYTVLIWKQNVSGDGYDFVESVTVENAPVNSIPNAVNATNGRVTGATYNGEVGFKFKETDQASKTVAPEGNTVVNVYYDRNEYTLIFQYEGNYSTEYIETTSNYGTQYGVWNGEYVNIYYNDGVWYRTREWKRRHREYSNPYEGTRYTTTYSKWHTIKTITALYGQNIRDNFPIVGTNGTTYAGAFWSPYGSSIFDDDKYVSYIDTMQAESTTFRLAYNPTANYDTYHVKYYVEALPTDTDTVTYDGKRFTLYHDAEIHYEGTLLSTESEEFTDITGFEKYGSNPAYSNGEAIFDENRTISLYYTRKAYPINFMDGIYVDGNGNELENHNTEHLKSSEEILYGSDLTSYNKTGSNYYKPTAPVGYVFEGWYLDSECTEKVNFSTMPEGGLTVYAKWRQKQYRVFLHPDPKNEKDTSLDLGDQETSFRVSYGEQISDGNAIGGTRDDYELIGWYTEYDGESYNNPFNFASYVLNDTTVTTQYNKTESTETDKYGNPKEGQENVNTDKDRFRINTKLDLYAKWRSKLEGASGMNIIYDAGEGSNAPKDEGLYLDLAEALAGPAATAPNGKQFKYWVVQKWNGSKYEDVDPEVTVYPGETFEVLKANAKKVAKPDNTAENPSYTYTVQLRAEYKTLGEQEVTSIQYCPNYEGAECTAPETIDVDVEFTTTGEIFTREGYTFSGWNTQADGKGTDFGTGVSGLAADNLGVEENKVNVLYAIWNVNNYDYTVEYYYNNVKDETKTETGNAEFNSTIRTYTDKVEFGYTLSGAEGLPLTITANPENNVIKVYYKIDENQTKEISYTVEYYKDEVPQTTDTVIKTESVQVLQPDTLTFERSLIDENKYTGYTLSGTKPDSIGDTVNSGDTIKVYYVKRNDLHYTVNYLEKDTNKVLTGAKTVEGQIFGSEITSANEKVEISGYNYDSADPETLTIAEENNVINVYYTKKNNLSYVVHYYEEGTMNRVAEDKTKTNQIFGDEVKEIAISIDGYNTTGDAEKTIIIAEGENEITFYYKKRTDLSYTVYYKLQGTDKDLTGAKIAENQTFGSKVTENAVTIEGYTVVAPSTAEIEITTGTNEYTFYYKANEDTAYKVEHYLKDLNADTYTLTGTDNLSGVTNEVAKATPNTYEGFTFDENNKNNVLTGVIAADGSLVLKVYYKRDTHIVTFDETGFVCEYGDTVAVPREIPTKTGDAQYSYTFAGWQRVGGTESGAVLASGTTEVVCETATYEPTFDETVNKYTIKFVDEDGTELQSSEVAYGETPEYTGNEPTKEADTVYTYAFSGWTPEVVEVTGEATYTATYSGTYIDYTVTFDNTGVQCHSGEKVPVPTYIPTKDSDETYIYEFAGWKIVNSETTSQAVMSGDVDCENIKYESTFKGTYIEYSVKWMDDNTELSGAVYHYNDSIVKLANPTKSGYVFSGWDPTVAEKVTGDATYTAEWKDDKNNNGTADDEETFTVIYKDGETELKKVENLSGGDTLEAYTPTKKDYVFDAWTPEWKATVDAADANTGNEIIYNATWKDDKNNNGTADDEETFTVIYKDGETELKKVENLSGGDTLEAYTPTKKDYVFDAWDPEWKATVDAADANTGNEIIYNATWKDDKNNNGTADDEETFTVIYKDGETELKKVENLSGGDTLEVYTPTKKDYVFDAWDPEWKATVDAADANTGNEIIYNATWKDDKNNNGTADDEETFTVIYKDGETELKKVENLSGGDTLEVYTPTKKDYVFDAWDPEWKATVDAADANTGNEIIYNATWKDDKNNNGIDDTTELVAITFKAGDHGKLEKGTTGYTTEKTLLPGYDKYPTAPSTTADEGWKFTKWSPDYKVGETIPLSGAELEYTAQWEKISNGGGGGGGGGSSTPDTYKCENLPDNAEPNNQDKPNKRTSYTYDEEGSSKVCTFHCKSGYTRDKENKKCVKSENPGGGNGGGDEEEIELGGQVSDKCSVEGFNGSEEEKAAYLYACENDITTIRDINEARLRDFLNRAEMAKMVSVFATKELGMKPNTSKDCSNFAESIAHYSQEMKDYMVMSCQLEIMGIHTTNYKAIPDFMPSKRVSRAEFGTILSRVLWGNKYEGTNENYYINHLNALKENNIITNINPNITEYRAWVFLMLYRAVEAIKVLKSTNNVAIDQQVNEELQEEGKAETGLVVEYDSGSVVPDMATVTESGTLATGAVAKVESGNVAGSQTGATTLTGEDASKEVSAETGAVAETGSISN